MAKKRVNKSQAVREYLESHPQAMSGEIATTLARQGVKITPGYVANIKSQLARGRGRKPAKTDAAPTAAAVEPVSPVSEKTVKVNEQVSFEQIRAVAEAANSLGGLHGLRRLLELVQELGGPKRVQELLDAMSVAANAQP